MKDYDFSNLSSSEKEELLLLLENTRLEPVFHRFEPHDAQAAFMMSDASETIIIGGNQSGKSEVGTVLALCFATGIYPPWFPDRLKLDTPNRGRICGPNLKDWVNEILGPKLKRWLPDQYIKSWVTNPQTKSLDQLVLVNGSVIDIMSYQQDQMAFESWTGNWAWFDEPAPRDKYIATVRGLAALNGKVFMTLTPLTEPWIYQLIESCKTPQKLGGKVFYEGGRSLNLGAGLTKSSKVRIVPITTDDNLIKENWRGVRAGGMSAEGLSFFLSTLSADEELVRRYGKFVHLQGLIYKEFNDSLHVIPDDQIPEEGTIYQVLDPHDAKPHAVAWYKVDPMGRMYGLFDAPIGGNLEDLAKEIQRIEKANNWTVERRILDPNKGKTPTSVSRRTWQEELEERGLYFDTDINDDIPLGHQVVRGCLKPKDSDKPRLYFAGSGMANTIFALKNYVYDTHADKDKNDVLKETPRQKYKDFPDCLRYFVMSNPEYISLNIQDNDLYNPGNFQTSTR